jgi:hypothetical protein
MSEAKAYLKHLSYGIPTGITCIAAAGANAIVSGLAAGSMIAQNDPELAISVGLTAVALDTIAAYAGYRMISDAADAADREIAAKYGKEKI